MILDNVLLFSFEDDDGSRESCSVFYCSPLVVLSPDPTGAAVTEIIERVTSYDEEAKQYDGDFDRALLVQELNDAGYPAKWQELYLYVNQG